MGIKLLFLNLLILRFFSNGGIVLIPEPVLLSTISPVLLIVSHCYLSLWGIVLCLTDGRGLVTVDNNLTCSLSNLIGQTHSEIASFSSRYFPLYFCSQVYRFIIFLFLLSKMFILYYCDTHGS